MARQQKAASESPKTVELVSPNGEITREVTVDSKEEVSLRFDGYLPAEQAELKAPEKPTPSPVEQTVGTNA